MPKYQTVIQKLYGEWNGQHSRSRTLIIIQKSRDEVRIKCQDYVIIDFKRDCFNRLEAV